MLRELTVAEVFDRVRHGARHEQRGERKDRHAAAARGA